MAERATITLTDMAHGGAAVGFWQGQAVFVPLGIPGEVVTVILSPGKGRSLRGRLIEVVQASPQRISPQCPYFGACGGCHWQHIAYSAQLAFKERIVANLLKRIGGQADPPMRPALGMAEPWAYRNRVQLRLDREGHIGFYAQASHMVIPVETCAITHPLVWSLRESLEVDFTGLRRIVLRAGLRTHQQMVLFEGRGALPPALEVTAPVSCLYLSDRGELTVMAGSSALFEEVEGKWFQISGPSFFQNNTEQVERLIAVVREYLDLQPGETLLDAYCGVGTLAYSLARADTPLIAIEGSPWAVRDAEANARRLLGGEADVMLIEATVEEALPALDRPYDAAILDPPRSGCEPAVIEAISRQRPSRIVYVSCDPASLARDVARLTAQGYRLESAQIVDMFPQTYHIETVALLHRTGS
ncbi:MAG: class I SAM-dependent RNA methyltransferase [Chloroflexi bacterium]|nr:class I SAM-dependent RNA methyltransferase [Chloroflexota bacterium]